MISYDETKKKSDENIRPGVRILISKTFSGENFVANCK